MASQASRKHAAAAPVIPDRLYFKIGDVARICGLDAYVLRFWETQFPQLKPNKSGTGQRLYRRRDVELVLDIQRLLHKDGYTIPGARHALEAGDRRAAVKPDPPSDLRPAAPPLAPDPRGAAIAQARADLRQIASMLSNPIPVSAPANTHKSAPVHPRPRIVKPHPDSETLFPV